MRAALDIVLTPNSYWSQIYQVPGVTLKHGYPQHQVLVVQAYAKAFLRVAMYVQLAQRLSQGARRCCIICSRSPMGLVDPSPGWD